MNDPKLSAALSQAVYELTTVPPHVPPDARFSRDEWPVYCDGYTWGIVMALRVIDDAARKIDRRARVELDAGRAAALRYFWRVMRWERMRAVHVRERGAA